MAQGDQARHGLARGESIADLVDDLKLLKVSPNGHMTSESMEKAREQKIKELRRENGTLNEVSFCFPQFCSSLCAKLIESDTLRAIKGQSCS